MNDCKHLYADWCHCPKYDEQVLCPYFTSDTDYKICRGYERKEAEE